MKKISLIFSVHEDRGLANSSELCALLKYLQPQVIFLEVPPSAFDKFYSACTRSNLESIAVRQYRDSHGVELIPVDLPTPEKSFFKDYKNLQQKIEEKSTDARRLIQWHSNYVKDYGFPYLNSDNCSKMWSDINADMQATIEKFDDPDASKILELWNTTMEQREDAMMKGIQKYCYENTFERGVFLIGAAHRNSVIEKSKLMSSVGSDEIQWHFF
jgi:hypothetical protein